MKTIKIMLTMFITGISYVALAQTQSVSPGVPTEVMAAIKNDDASALQQLITKDNVNTCYGDYSVLSQAVRYNAKKCFDQLIAEGADVNKSCNGYVPPLMHAAKYGHLDMVKILVSKGADINYKYSGTYQPADGETPLTYAEKNNQPAVADYLRSLK